MMTNNHNVQPPVKVLIVGANSGLGKGFTRYLYSDSNYIVSTVARDTGCTYKLDLRDDEIPFENEHFDIAIVFAAMTNMERCQESPALAMEVNCNAILRLFDRASVGKWVVFSTNQVFSGEQPKQGKHSLTKPYNMYGKTKQALEQSCRNKSNVAVIRMTKIITRENTLLKKFTTDLKAGKTISAFDDMTFSPVWEEQVYAFLITLIDNYKPGLYQLSGDCDVSYYEFMRYCAKTLVINPDQVHASNKPVKSPKYTSLKVDKEEYAREFRPVSYCDVADLYLSSLRQVTLRQFDS